MLQRLSFFRKNLVRNIPVFMLLGLLVGYFFEVSFFKSAVLPLTILTIYPIMVTLKLRSVFSGCNYRLEARRKASTFIFIPLAAFLLARIFSVISR